MRRVQYTSSSAIRRGMARLAGPPTPAHRRIPPRKRLARLYAVLAALALLLNAGCQGRRSEAYRFEPTPRPVLANVGFTPSHSGRIGLDLVSSPDVHLLAVTGEGDGARLALFNSENGGDTFQPPVWVSEPGKHVTSAGEDSPAFLVTEGYMFAAWNEGRQLRFARSVSWGESFEKAVTVTDKKGDSFSGYPSIGIAPNQDVYVVWIDTRDQVREGDENYSLYLARSTDHGVSFGKNVRVATKICPCCRPTLAFGPAGEVMVIWRHIYPGPIHDMTVAISTDNGTSFSAPQRIAEDNWKINGCPDSGPATARSGKRVYVAWLTEATPEISGVRLGWSDDGGRTWAPAVRASQDILDANYPAFSVGSDGSPLLVFQGRDPDQRAGWGRFGVYAVKIASDATLAKPIAVPGIASSAMRPAVAAGMGGRVYVAWTGTQDNNQAVFLSRARSGAQ